MKRLTANQGKRLCELIRLLRPDWDLPGIEAAVRKAATDATAIDVCAAAVRAAGNDAARTPGLIPQPGPHWAQTAHGQHYDHPRCGLHPDYLAAGCPACQAVKRATPEQITAARAHARHLTRQEKP